MSNPTAEKHLIDFRVENATLIWTTDGGGSRPATAAELLMFEEIKRLTPMAESWESYEAAQERKAELLTSNERCKLAFEEWAESLGLCMDELVMSSAGVPEHPYEDNDTNQFWRAWLASWKACSAVETPCELPVAHSVRYDVSGWLCSWCHGWNTLRDSSCVHPHSAVKTSVPTTGDSK